MSTYAALSPGLSPLREAPCARLARFIPALMLMFTLSQIPTIAQDACEIEAVPSIAEVGRPVKLIARCPVEAGARYAWDLGNGDGYGPRMTRADTTYAFGQAGIFTVLLRWSSPSGVLFANRQVTVVHSRTASPPVHSATLVLDEGRSRIYNVNRDNHSVTASDPQRFVRLWERPAGRNPRTLALDARGDVWVANQDDATLSVLDGATGSPKRTIALPYASRPYGIAFDPSGAAAYVTLEALGQLAKVDAASGKVVARIDVCPRPRGLAITHDGKRIFVTRFISAKDKGEVVEVDAAAFARKKSHALAFDPGPDSRSGSRGVPNYLVSIAISPDGRRAWIPSKKDNTARGKFLENSLPDFETTVRSIVSQLDLISGREVLEERVDIDNRNLPVAVAFSPAGEHAFVATQGSNAVDVLDAGVRKTVATLVPELADSLLAPDGLVLRGDSLLFVHYFATRRIAVFDAREVGRSNIIPRLARIATVEKEALAPEVLRGQQVFYNSQDERMAKEGYISCATCHLEGGSDGRVWDFTDRGEGLRRTTTLQGKAGLGQGALHWSANFDEVQDFEHDIRGPFGGLGFMGEADFGSGGRNTPLGGKKAGLSPELDALTAYVGSLAAVNPSPHRNSDGSMTAEAVAGKALFGRADVGCAVCHTGPELTDSKIAAPGGSPLLHDVGTLKPGSGQRLKGPLMGLDTPTLKGLWEGGPYLHDGSASSLLDVITTANLEDKHGKTSLLSAAEKQQLVAFLLQLDGSGDAVAAAIRGRRPPSDGRRAAHAAFIWIHGAGLRWSLPVLEREAETVAAPIEVNTLGRKLPSSVPASH